MLSFSPIIATEIEFYLFGSRGRDIDAYWQEVRAGFGEGIFKIEKEKGEEQHEVALDFTRDKNKIIANTNRLKQIVAEVAVKHGMRADFSAKPVKSEPGSGLHVHVHIEDAAGNNLYTKDGDEMSDALSWSIGGLLATMQENMNIFAPNPQSVARFTAGSNAPTTVSWGANNRTCAIRLPDKGSFARHIEHRVAGADADVGAVIEAILAGIGFGLENKIAAPAQIYGDASLAQYALPKLVA